MSSSIEFYNDTIYALSWNRNMAIHLDFWHIFLHLSTALYTCFNWLKQKNTLKYFKRHGILVEAHKMCVCPQVPLFHIYWEVLATITHRHLVSSVIFALSPQRGCTDGAKSGFLLFPSYSWRDRPPMRLTWLPPQSHNSLINFTIAHRQDFFRKETLIFVVFLKVLDHFILADRIMWNHVWA